MDKNQAAYIIDLLQRGEPIPEDMKQVLFPPRKAEYELTYAGKMRREDILAGADEVLAVPLQREHVYGETSDWHNLLVFGDNLQFLKTVYEDRDPLLRGKVKGRVQMIYIDPPFATEYDFSGKEGEKSYTDKRAGAEFIEFLRRRLIVAREILAPDGVIYVHLDWKKVHYIKLVMDEVFGENHFKNEIIWKYFGPTSTSKNYPRKHEVILFYTNSDDYYFDSNATLIAYDEKAVRRYDRRDENGEAYKIYYDEDGRERRAYMKDGKPTEVFQIPFVQGTARERLGYPTQKPEALIERFIRASTRPGDLVMDFFAGSGTTLAAAEKLGRRWIGCDIGKFSYYLIQKRLLQIGESKSLQSKKKYGRSCRPFMTCVLGAYELRKALELEWDDYKVFAAGLFGVTLAEQTVRGVRFEGELRGCRVKFFNYQQFTGSAVDEAYLEEIEAAAGGSLGSRVYIIAPANYIAFFSDYYEIGETRYYFLKIPYQMIRELHKTAFAQARQPKSKHETNGVEEIRGFHFNRTPDVQAEYAVTGGSIIIRIAGFTCNEPEPTRSEREKTAKGTELLSAVMVDTDYNGRYFSVTHVFYQDEIDDAVHVPLEGGAHTVMVKYIDIYGNEFTEKVQVYG